MTFSHSKLALAFLLLLTCTAVNGQLSEKFYTKTCPRLQDIVRNGMSKAVAEDRRTAASILRTFFHDCFVQGCDASILLDGGEKTAIPNQSLRRFEVIDTIKARVEATCSGIVSCADILALAALEGVAAVGGPRWKVGLGRRDTRTAASNSTVLANLPPPSFNLSQLITSYGRQGLNATDMVALSGAHTIGLAQCSAFRPHIYNDTNIAPAFAALRKTTCPPVGNDTVNAPLDLKTSTRFDNNYYKNLVVQKGLLHSDQALFGGGSQDDLVRKYSKNQAAFFHDFATAMTKMGSINPLTGSSGEIRKNCRVPN